MHNGFRFVEVTKSELDLFSVPPTQTSMEQGSSVEYHSLTTVTWVCVYVENGRREFFDWFGRRPNETFECYLNRHGVLTKDNYRVLLPNYVDIIVYLSLIHI